MLDHLQETVRNQQSQIDQLKKENDEYRSMNREYDIMVTKYEKDQKLSKAILEAHQIHFQEELQELRMENLRLSAKGKTYLQEKRTLRDKIASLQGQRIVDNNNINLLRSAVEDLTDQNDMQNMMLNEYKKQATNYLYIREFETLYDAVRTITKSSRLGRINKHLKGEIPNTRQALRDLLQSDDPHKEFHRRRELRNEYAHLIY
jgi:chromosome segregation ATPase